MHPVLAKLGAERRRELFANPHFSVLPEPSRAELFDAVLKIRAGLNHQDTIAVVNDPAARRSKAEELKGAIVKTLDILDGPLGPDIVQGLWPYYPEGYYDPDPRAHSPDPFYGPEEEEHVCKKTLRRILWAIEHLAAEPQDAQFKRKASEASALRFVLRITFRIKVTMETPSRGRPNHGLGLIGLLADPPASAGAMLKRLRRRGHILG